MNLRNTLNGEKEHGDNTITFSLNWDEWTNVSYTCDSVSLASFLLNIVDLGDRLLKDEWFPDGLIEAIHNQWKESIDNLSTK